MIDIMEIFTRDCNTNLIFIGGELNRARDGFIGAITIEQIKKYMFDLSFLGVVGIDVFNNKVATYDINDGLTKKEVLNASRKCYMAGETIKFELDGNYLFGDISDFSGYICEGGLDSRIENKLKDIGIEII